MSEITLKVSIGEALDKLSILSIKLIKIKEKARIKEVEKEFLILEKKLNKYKERYDFQYKILCKINESIWKKLEIFRNLEKLEINDPQNYELLIEQNNLFKDITNENDDRYRVKNKINFLCDSNLKEQKGYKLKQAFVLSHLGLGDCICMNGLVRYLATKYDKVIIACEDRYKKNIELMYKDDLDIELHLVNTDASISVNFGFDKNNFNSITKDADVYEAGYHVREKEHKPFNDLPFNFYDDMKIDRQIFWNYYYIPKFEPENDLYLKYLQKQKFIFIHSTTSGGDFFTLEEAEKQFNFNRNNILIINPCKNVYEKNDKFFEIAEKLKNHTLIYYKTIIEKALNIILSDSSFFCFSICLKTDAGKIYLKARDRSYYNLENLNKYNNYIFW